MLKLGQIYNRTAEAEEILRFLSNPAERLLLVTGESGCGKSTVVEKALTQADERRSIPAKSILSYRFNDPDVESEAERFPQFLMDSFAKIRPLWFLDSWMRSHGYPPESWALRVPLASFNYLAPCLNDPYKADAFFPKLAKSLGSRYLLLRIENAENFGLHKNLIILEKLVNQPDGPKLLVEIGTLSSRANDAISFFQQRCHLQRLEVHLFNSEEATEYYRFVHDGDVPPSLLKTSRGNALAIRHHRTTFADLPVGSKIRRRLEGFSSNAVKLLLGLAALRGACDIDFLRIFLHSRSDFDAVLIELRQADVIRIDEDSSVQFAHSLFAGYLLSDTFAQDLRRYGRQPVIDYLKSRPQPSITESSELAQQYLGLGEHDLAWASALKSAYQSYRQENFRNVLNTAEVLDACRGISQSERKKAETLLLQTAIRTGDVNSAVKRLNNLDGDGGATTVLLRAQAYYLMNRFEEAAKLCGRIAPLAESEFFASRALGVRAASLVALGRHEEAANDFAAARQVAISVGDDQLDLELLRLSPEIEPAAVWKTRFDELKRSRLPDRYPYLYAKCLHNFGAFMLLDSGGETGTDELSIAATVFEAGRYLEYSYSAVMSATVLLLRGENARARALLEDAEIWCHEQYDTFAFKTNFGVAAALEGDWPAASVRFSEARLSLDRAPFPLKDPYFQFLANHNSAVASAGLGQFDEAATLLESTIVPSNCYDYEAKVSRRTRFISLFKEKCMPGIGDCPPTGDRSTTKTCILELATLQFFDFNVNVLPNDFL